MGKILYTANTDRHIILCHIPYLKMLKEDNHIVHVATNTDFNIDYIDEKIKLPIHRAPFRFGNIRSIFILRKKVLKEKYDLVITNTPMGSVVTRLACMKARKKYNTKVVYIAHGFHFYKGCKLINYILYYPVEKILSYITDTLITINKEDYNIAKRKLKAHETKYIKGIGFIDDKLKTTLSKSEQLELKKKIGIKKDEFVISYIAELSKRKRQDYLVKALRNCNLENTKVLLIGDNILKDKIPKLIKRYKLEKNVILIGFVTNVSDYLDISDIVLSVSGQEGLPLNVMEAMYKNKKIIVTDCRGNHDLIKNKKNGLVVPINDDNELIKSIDYFKNNDVIDRKNNKKYAIEYSIDNVKNEYMKIYNKYLDK